MADDRASGGGERKMSTSTSGTEFGFRQSAETVFFKQALGPSRPELKAGHAMLVAASRA